MICNIARSLAGGGNLQEKIVSASTSADISVTPDSGYDGMSKVTIQRVRLQTKSAVPRATVQNIEPDNEYDGLKRVTVQKIPGGLGAMTLTGDDIQSVDTTNKEIKIKTPSGLNVDEITRVTITASSDDFLEAYTDELGLYDLVIGESQMVVSLDGQVYASLYGTTTEASYYGSYMKIYSAGNLISKFNWNRVKLSTARVCVIFTFQ